jgi:hypothetical protein
MPLGKHRHIITVGGSNWNPSDSISTSFWIDGADTNSYTLSSNEYTAVTDKSGNFSTITITGTPNNLTGLNGYNTFSFDGTEDFTTSSEQAVASSGNHWCAGVFHYTSVDNVKDSFWSVENNTVSASSKRDYAISASNASTWDGELDLDGLSSNRISSTIGNSQAWDSGLSNHTWYIISLFLNKTGNQIGCRVSGANIFTPVNDYDNAINTNQDVRICKNRGGNRLAGKCAEFMIVADLPGTGATDITTLEKAEGYLAHKWGLTSNLPNDHPFKNVSP